MRLFHRSTLALIAASFFLPIYAADTKPPKDKGKGKSSQNEKKGKGKSPKVKEAKDPKKVTPPGKNQPDQWNGKKEKYEKLRFGDNDRKGINDFFSKYRSHKNGLPPGLAKNLKRGKGLPPGWQKKLEPGFIIEEPWLSNFTPVSYDYFPNLTHPENTRLYLYDDRLVRVYEPERRVLDVLILEGVKALLR